MTVARKLLADHMRKRRHAAEVHADAHRAAMRAAGQVVAAETAVSAASDDCAAVARQEAEHIAAWSQSGAAWPPPQPPADLVGVRREADAALGQAGRTLNVLRGNAQIALAPVTRAAAELAALDVQTEKLVVGIMAEEAASRLAHLKAARALTARAERSIRDLAEHLAGGKHHVTAEAIASTLFTMERPDWSDIAPDPAAWGDFAAEVAADASADAPAVL